MYRKTGFIQRRYMITRYKNGADGLDAVANIYSKNENGIDASLIDKEAVSVIRRLTDMGYESYLGGGAVRDLILGRVPKDFDVATSASPRQVHKLFYNSRIIGRRFKIVHIVYGKKIIEVSTFRSNKEHEYSNDNEYGTIEEDCTRRDFSINSLYYNPLNQELIDFNNALNDFEHKRLVSLIPLNKTFDEDPVRMIRAVKYSVTTGFKIPFKLSCAIKKYAPNIADVSTSRITEEVNKILASGNSSDIFKRLKEYKLLVYILPAISVYASFPQMFESLKVLDAKINSQKDAKELSVSRAEMYLGLVKPFININDELETAQEVFQDVLRQIKVLVFPITPPNYELESAAALFMKENNLSVPKGAVKHRNPVEAPVRSIKHKKQITEANAKPKKRKKHYYRKPKKATEAK